MRTVGWTTVARIIRAGGQRFRAKRMQQFLETFQVSQNTTILDVGGWVEFWDGIPECPRITVLNLDLTRPTANPRIDVVVADGRFLPFPDQSFDIVHSNSVIEHLGNPERQRQFAREVIRVGRSYYCQTPNKHFPFEPHYQTPFFQYVPKRLKPGLTRYLTVWGQWAKPSPKLCQQVADDTHLLVYRDVVSLFPDGRVRREYALGITKSFVVVGSHVLGLDGARRAT